MKKQLFWILAGTGSFVVSLLVMAPLPVLAQQLLRVAPDLKMAGVSGTLWKGQVQQLVTPQAQVNGLSWTFAPMALLKGNLAADVEADVQSVQVKGQCGVSVFTSLKCAPLQLNMDAANIQRLAPRAKGLPKLAGTLQAMLDDVSWDRAGLPLANGDVVWNDGGVLQPIKLDLGGQYRAKVRTSDKPGEALNIALQSQESKIVLDGTITVEADGRYQFDAFLKSSAEADPSYGDVLGMIAPVQADGSIKLKQNGQLSLPQKQVAAAQ